MFYAFNWDFKIEFHVAFVNESIKIFNFIYQIWCLLYSLCLKNYTKYTFQVTQN